jgi:hypothetical protein
MVAIQNAVHFVLLAVILGCWLFVSVASSATYTELSQRGENLKLQGDFAGNHVQSFSCGLIPEVNAVCTGALQIFFEAHNISVDHVASLTNIAETYFALSTHARVYRASDRLKVCISAHR